MRGWHRVSLGEYAMTTDELMAEVSEANLTYMMLAQKMVRDDKDSAMFRLGISRELADVLGTLTPGQILKLASTNLLLCRFRLDDNIVFNMISGYAKNRIMTQSHATILMAGQPAETII